MSKFLAFGLRVLATLATLESPQMTNTTSWPQITNHEESPHGRRVVILNQNPHESRWKNFLLYLWKESLNLENLCVFKHHTISPATSCMHIYIGIEVKNHQFLFLIKFLDQIEHHQLFTPKFGRRTRELTGFQDCANQGVDWVRIDTCQVECDTRIGSLRMTSADNDDEIWLAYRRYISDSTKGERLESKLP